MIKDTYPYFFSEDKLQYSFVSLGEQGEIQKFVLISYNEENEWNLGFGDLNNGQIDDSVITKNHDAMKTMRTVARIVLEFFEEYPRSVLVIQPIDEKRKRFYNLIFQKFFMEIDDYFQIVGIIDDNETVYSPKNLCDSFKISYKFAK